MLVVSWYLARWCTRRFDVPATMAARALMGAVAFVVLMIMEAGIGALLFDQNALLGTPWRRSVLFAFRGVQSRTPRARLRHTSFTWSSARIRAKIWR